MEDDGVYGAGVLGGVEVVADGSLASVLVAELMVRLGLFVVG